MKKANKHIGSDFDDFLKENNILDECEASATKRVLTWQIEQAMRETNISKSELARRMHTSRAVVDRMLNPENPSITLQTMEKAARAVNRRLTFELKMA
ncbi:MAG: helix-turn-helix transcriptional regulator [Victivallaceae bacterium]